MARIEETILNGLVFSDAYTRKVLPFLKKEYFNIHHEAILLEVIVDYITKYNELPTKESLKIDLSNRKDLSDQDFVSVEELIDTFEKTNTNPEWLISETEKFCRKRSVYNAIMDAIKIIDGRDKNRKEEAIPTLLQEALAVSFDTSVGHSYFNEASNRYDFYNTEEEKIPFDLNIFNKAFNKGMPRKSLIVVAAQSGGGKSLVMTHMAGAALLSGLNVLYISMEMSENRISERIDANLLKVDIQKIIDLGKEQYMNRIDTIREKTRGELYVKEYGPGSASSANFRTLLEELKVKKNFTPDIIFADYLGIIASSRVKMGGNVNNYFYLKSVSEELRSLAVDFNVPVVTGAQLNRSGFNNSDFDETSMADSMGIFMTADIVFGCIRSDELDELGQIMIKKLKDRYGDLNYYRRFVIGIDRPKMKIYDLESSAQSGLVNNPPPIQQNSPPSRPNRIPNGFDSLNF